MTRATKTTTKSKTATTVTKRTTAKSKSYTVTFERDERSLWVATVKGLPGCHTQGRTISQARERIREALSLFDDHADKAEFDEHIVLPAKVNTLVEAQRSVRSKQEALEAELRALNLKAARALTEGVGLSLRDAGELLGASQEAVRQWVS